MYLTVTIDTEEDNWGEYNRTSYSVRNIGRIPRLQQLFLDRGVRPTYLITYPVATNPGAIRVLGRYRDEGLCEIGSHPHPWNTPPVEEPRTAFNSYISHLSPELQYRKMKTLHDTIAANFGTAPTSYRSGRWGFSDDVARNLIRLGYHVDTSISPVSDWSEYLGVDYSRWSHEPFVYRDERGRSLLEVPATIDFVQSPTRIASSTYWALKRKVRGGHKVLAALSRMRLLNRVCISPETHDPQHMIRLASRLMERGTKVINMFFHSPSLLERCSPFVRSEADVTRFLRRIDEVLAFAQSAGLRFVSMSELQAADVGASKVKVLTSAVTTS